MASFEGRYTFDLRRKRKRWKDGRMRVSASATGTSRRKIAIDSDDGRNVLSGYMPKGIHG